jgi:hypothetical protein
VTFRMGDRRETRQWRGSVQRCVRAFALGVWAVILTTGGAAWADGGLEIELEPGTSNLSTAYAPMRVTFKNTGDSELRILDVFEPIPVFFQFSISKQDGTPITVPGGGKIDPPAGAERYIAIAPGGRYTREIDIAGLLPKSEWVTGDYYLWVTYRNAYGQGCFRGTAESNAITATIERTQ